MKKKDPLQARKAFTRYLLQWNKQQNTRQMPWKGEKDPYKIWLSEIILQQTRVDQGMAYYSNFIKTFPDIHKLAGAPDEKVFKLWEGLGYYSRCRNLLHTARYIASELNGKFPSSYEEIMELKGVGSYTAAAISSFAFNLPHAVVDGNVYRVLARIFGLSIPTDSTAGKKEFNQLAGELLDQKEPGAYNQAIMDFGAVVCKPAAPLCTSCVFNKMCTAYQEDRVNELPVKEKKIKVRKRWFYYLVIEQQGKIAISRRSGKDIWQDLYEFPMIETTAELGPKQLQQQLDKWKWLKGKKYELTNISPLYRQLLSHQLIAGKFIHIKIKQPSLNKVDEGAGNWLWVKKSELKDYAWPRFINQYLEAGN